MIKFKIWSFLSLLLIFLPFIAGFDIYGRGKKDVSSVSTSQDLVFLLIGQSNMAGFPSPHAEDKVKNERVKVLAYSDNLRLGRVYNQWYTASPPLHNEGVGPGDYFGKTMAESLPNANIYLIPCAISGVDIDFFRKGIKSKRRKEFYIPPNNKADSAYEMVIEKALLGKEKGQIAGILFHQGESDTGQSVWIDKVAEMVENLRTDLNLGNVPFLAGELLVNGCCSSHNNIINRLPEKIANAHVISSNGLVADPKDKWNAHFGLESQRELGRRYAKKMLELLRT